MLNVLTPIALNSSTFTAITVPLNSAEKTYILQCDAAVDVSLANEASATTKVFTLKSGNSLAVRVVPVNPQGTIYTLCYAKSASVTPNMQILQVD